jgi:hypothetical protein
MLDLGNVRIMQKPVDAAAVAAAILEMIGDGSASPRGSSQLRLKGLSTREMSVSPSAAAARARRDDWFGLRVLRGRAHRVSGARGTRRSPC